MIMTVQDVIDIYQENLKRFDFFSDPQRIFMNDCGHLVICIGNYDWFVTKNKVESAEEALRALFEIERLYWYIVKAERGVDNEIIYIDYSDYWNEYY